MAGGKQNKKVYVVFRGRSPGIYMNWNDCEPQVHGYPGATFQSYSSFEEAEFHLQNFYIGNYSGVARGHRLLENAHANSYTGHTSDGTDMIVGRPLPLVEGDSDDSNEQCREPMKRGHVKFCKIISVVVFLFIMWLMFCF